MSHHANLPLQDSEIRILRLHPATTDDDPLKCTLETVLLDSSPIFIAVSYTWGAPAFNDIINCNGKDVLITKTLSAALKRFRRTESSSYWIDQICIDQTNVEERNNQVALMQRIYKSASNVHVWLGDHTEFTERGIALAIGLASHPDLEFLREEYPTTGIEAYQQQADSKDPAFIGYIEIFESPWFSRAWVIQEVLAKSNPIAFIGDFTFPWKILPGTIISLYLHQKAWMRHAARFSMSEAWDRSTDACIQVVLGFGKGLREYYPFESAIQTTIAQFLANPRLNLVEKLVCARIFSSTDPRDKVFALLGILDDLDDFKPDYNLSTQEVYQKLGEYLISSGWGGFLLPAAGSHQITMENLPSWCLDLRHAGKICSFVEVQKGLEQDFHAGGTLRLPIKLGPQVNEVTCKGAGIGKIITLGKTLSRPSGPKEVALAIWARDTRALIHDHESIHKRYDTVAKRDDAFFRLIIANEPRFRTTAFQSFKEFHNHGLARARAFAKKDLANYLPEDIDKQWEKFEEYQPLLDLCSKDRMPFITESGYLGLGNPALRVGDEVCILMGCATPLIMREIASSDRVSIVCDSFVLDIMDGELVDNGSLDCKNIIIQ